MAQSAIDLILYRKRLEALAAERLRHAQPPLNFKPVWRVAGLVDVFEQQTCTACGSINTIHHGRFVLMLDEQGDRRLTRQAIVPDGTTPSRDIWHSETAVCVGCWNGEEEKHAIR